MRQRITSRTVKAVAESEVLTWLADEGCIPHGHAAGNIRFQAVFFIGPAASGKSFHKEKRYLKHLQFKDIDPDKIKKLHKDYDPNEPGKGDVHKWSKAEANAQFVKIVTEEDSEKAGRPVIVDGTGRNWAGIAEKMELAKENGYRTFLVYIYVPKEISIFRNRNRERFVPESAIEEQSRNIATSYKKLKSVADKSKVIIGYDKAQVKAAEKDIEVYPVPWQGPPIRPPRPYMDVYGLSQEELVEIGWNPKNEKFRPIKASDRRLSIAKAMLKLASTLLGK